MKTTRKLTSIFIISSVLCSFLGFSIPMNVYAQDNINYYLPSDNDSFANDRIMVVLDNKTSLLFNDYQVSDFKNVDCKRINEISEHVRNKVKNAMENIAQHVVEKKELLPYNGVALNEYNQVLCIELNTPGKDNVIKAIKRLRNLPGVLFVEPDFIMEECSVPNDPKYADQAIKFLSFEAAWDITTGSSSVKVGVIDSGIWVEHEDLNDNVYEEMCRDFSSGQTELGGTTDTVGHGTNVAGIIGAEGDNSLAITGVCWDVSLVSLKIGELSSHAAVAIDYAELRNIPIINMSISWSQAKNNYTNYNISLMETINNYSGLFICSAGNKDVDIDNTYSYPSHHNLSNMITVGACTSSGEKKSNSNYGKNTVDLFALGVSLLTTGIDSSTDTYVFNDTSAATPLVSGVAALMLSVNPCLTSNEIKHIIMTSVDKSEDLESLCVSGGFLNPFNAVLHARDHIRTFEDPSSTTHNYYCDDCNYSIEEAHEFTYTETNTSTHLASCDFCGYTKSVSHVFTYTSVSNAIYHNISCRICGYFGTQSHIWDASGSTTICTLCNQTSSSVISPILSLPPEDEEELTE